MKATKKYIFEPDYAVPPGETIQEVMASLDMSQKEFALRLGMTAQSLNRIFKGDQPITYETANRLELATGVPASFWNNLEAKYQEQLIKLKERKYTKRDEEWLSTIPIRELKKRNFIRSTAEGGELLREAFSFFGVSSVDAWNDIWEASDIAARRSLCFETDPGSASAWIRQGELQAYKITCKPFDKLLFHETLKKIRGLTRKSAKNFQAELRWLCAEAGVAVAFVPEMKKVPWNGATKWLSPRKAMILLSLRGKGEDKFWFSFFHEAGHVLNDRKKDLLINDDRNDDPREAKANQFAAEFLIPPKYNADIKKMKTEDQIVDLAQELGISPGIVAGRYQFITKKWNYFKGLIRHFKWDN